ncbi:TonB family protein [Bradyrhizobium sp.]|jgi:protein TonB|uniref:TonB family protein n=1 Tax=Bradyrhizobium sp. TaxID=376 RepID=UPI002D06A521|nr:TonB family protein [Bradyrhizobium sp.]HWX59504.1 TonB family protein [Bradyrhizobium sp.]
MNAHALHQPGDRGVARWLFAGVAILIAHAAVVGATVLWYARQPPEPNILPAITVTLAPVEGSSPEIQTEDVAIGPRMQQADEAPKEPPKVEEKPVEQVVQPPPPQQQAEITLPRVEQKVEQPTPEAMPPAPETRAPPKNERVAQFTEASAKAYNALVFGHLQRFKRYPRALRGAHGTVVMQFVLDRTGRVIDSFVKKSSGSRALDQQGLDDLHRASPFPPFPDDKPGDQDAFVAPIEFSLSD